MTTFLISCVSLFSRVLGAITALDIFRFFLSVLIFFVIVWLIVLLSRSMRG